MGDHWNALENVNRESPLVEHHMEVHPDLPHNFVMEVKSFHEQPLDRQVEEAELIGSFEGNLLNRKREWGQNLPPKLSIEGKEGQKTAAGQVKRKVKQEITKSQESQGTGMSQGQARTEGQEGQEDTVPPPAKRMRSKITQREIPVQVKSKSIHLNLKQIVEKMRNLGEPFTHQESQPTPSRIRDTNSTV